jgi:hypothetical protein
LVERKYEKEDLVPAKNPAVGDSPENLPFLQATVAFGLIEEPSKQPVTTPTSTLVYPAERVEHAGGDGTTETIRIKVPARVIMPEGNPRPVLAASSSLPLANGSPSTTITRSSSVAGSQPIISSPSQAGSSKEPNQTPVQQPKSKTDLRPIPPLNPAPLPATISPCAPAAPQDTNETMLPSAPAATKVASSPVPSKTGPLTEAPTPAPGSVSTAGVASKPIALPSTEVVHPTVPSPVPASNPIVTPVPAAAPTPVVTSAPAAAPAPVVTPAPVTSPTQGSTPAAKTPPINGAT